MKEPVKILPEERVFESVDRTNPAGGYKISDLLQKVELFAKKHGVHADDVEIWGCDYGEIDLCAVRPPIANPDYDEQMKLYESYLQRKKKKEAINIEIKKKQEEIAALKKKAIQIENE